MSSGPGPLLSVCGLSLRLPTTAARRSILVDIAFEIEPGEIVGLVGESGSGKSMTARSVIRLLPPDAELDGEITFDGESVIEMTETRLRRHRSSDVAMIFQDARAHINPVRRIGDFLVEGLVRNRGVGHKEAWERAEAVLDEVEIEQAARRLRQYPHELSGGMLQRVMIASALLSRPRLLLADEPTSSLDVTTQSGVAALLHELCDEHRMAMLFITHDIELAAALCDRIAVMYAGQIVEDRLAAELVADPLHPYSAGLLASRPSVASRRRRLDAIAGQPRSAFEAPQGCVFRDRCPHVTDVCTVRPPLEKHAGGLVRCARATDLHHSAKHGNPL